MAGRKMLQGGNGRAIHREKEEGARRRWEILIYSLLRAVV